jgi:hypothetical protein
MSHKKAKAIRRAMKQAGSIDGGQMESQYMQQQNQQLPNFRNIRLRPECKRARYQQIKREEKRGATN